LNIHSADTKSPVEQEERPDRIEGPVPSAFCRHNKTEMDYLQIHLFRNVEWLTHVKIPFKIDFESVVSELILQHAKNYFIVGCNYGNFKYLSDRGYKGIRMGREAILNLHHNHFRKRSLKELIRRGKKNRKVVEISWSEEAAVKLQEFRKHTRHGLEPQLQYLFGTSFEECNRLFVIENEVGMWLGAILLSYKSNNYVQTEAMLTRRKQPIGVMEALIYEIFKKLTNEGYDYWTLGAVPFIIHDSVFLSKEFVINVTGRFMRFAYNYKGLFNFKNKFDPIWADYYICIRPHFSPGAMLGILFRSNLLKLGIHKLIHLGRRM
jgi:lysylphosphatidylglycerol synthetase-like protein (DUF2156 family)